MNAYEILGLNTASSEEEVIKAYRRLAMKWHPDRNNGSKEAETQFKIVKEAYEVIQANGFRPLTARGHQGSPGSANWQGQWDTPRAPGNTWRDRNDIGSIFEDLKAFNAAGHKGSPEWQKQQESASKTQQNTSELVAQISLRSAFTGFNMVVPRTQNGMTQHHTCHIPAGTPNGYRGRYKASDGTVVTVTTRIETGSFSLRSFAEQNNLFSAGLHIGDIEISMEVDALDLINGAWIDTQDFLNEQLRVRIPQGFNPLHRLKVAGKGYYGWLQEYTRPSNNRMDMFIKLIPIFKKPSDIDPQKIIELYSTIKENAS